MENYISLFIIIPFLGFLVNALISNKNEVRLSQSSFVMLGIQFVFALVFTAYWLYKGAQPIYQKQFTLLRLPDFELYIDFLFDGITAVYLLVGAFVAFLISTYSRNYLHREAGFKRFFATILFFYLGYNLIVLSGNLTTIFAGWEIAGVSSFLLIAYYRNRFIPVKNAIKIFSVYRLGDICIMLAMWLGHQIWHEHVSLHKYLDVQDVVAHIEHYPYLSIGFVLCIFTAAAIKSAQFPFSAWLPRAMEGPTPSSAIFYSSLAVHLGILVLLRTYDFWIHVPYMQELIIGSGAFSFVLSTIAARIQPTIKGQIAYSVVAQVGLMAIEVALGWHELVLVHFASHAMLRSYQLLISPSIVSYALKQQFFEFKPVKRLNLHPIFRNLSNSIYILSLNEWYLDSLMHHLVWGPFKKMGTFLQKIPMVVIKWLSFGLIVIIPVVVFMIKSGRLLLDPYLVSSIILGIAFFYILRIFTERKRVLYAWYKIACFHLFIVCAMSITGVPLLNLSFYIGGITLSFVVGHIAMNKIRKEEGMVSLHGYQGHCYEYPMTEFFFFLSCLGLMGFPITSAFIGMELLLSGVTAYQPVLLVLLLLSFLVNGLAMIRIYARIFLGPHVKTYHTSARKSS